MVYIGMFLVPKGPQCEPYHITLNQFREDLFHSEESSLKLLQSGLHLFLFRHKYLFICFWGFYQSKNRILSASTSWVAFSLCVKTKHVLFPQTKLLGPLGCWWSYRYALCALKCKKIQVMLQTISPPHTVCDVTWWFDVFDSQQHVVSLRLCFPETSNVRVS